MTNFLEYIDEDMQSKKTLFSTMPTNTKANKRKFNAKIDSVKDTYLDYKKSIKKYIELKSKSFHIADTRNTTEFAEKIADLANIRFILNPINTYFEKIGFDSLFYQLTNYQDVNFGTLNNIINEFINKFETAGIKLTKKDFNYTYYVNQFMSAFLDVKTSPNSSFDSLTEIFEKIYWDNPDIISHIELNFRRLIRINEKKFINYINLLQEEVSRKSNLNYQTCLEKLASTYRELNAISKENISDIIELAKTREIDVNNFFEGSKIRTTTFNSLMIDSLNLSDLNLMNKFYDSLEKLKNNLEEYSNYLKFTPLILEFKKEYLKSFDGESNSKVDINKPLKELEEKITQNENKLYKLNKKIFNSDRPFLGIKEKNLKELKFESIKLANGLKELYQKYIEEYFRIKVLSTLNTSFTVNDLLHLYYSFDFYKKTAIKKIYELNSYEDLLEYSDIFDLFAMNPTNVIVCSAFTYEENIVSKVIVNKYRLLNINLIEEDLTIENLPIFLEKLYLVSRIREIESSSINIEKLWFIAEVAKLIEKENKKNGE